MGGDPQQVEVQEDQAGARFDRALSRLAGMSRSRARRLIESGAATLARDPRARARTPVESGDVLSYELVDESGPHGEPIEIDVRYEDEHLAVVAKRAGMVTHPGPGHDQGTMVSALLHRWPQVRGVGEHPRWGIVHRLDRETSGLMVVAKDEPTRAALSEALRVRAVARSYRCLVHGAFGSTTGTIEAPIDRIRSRRVVRSGGRPSVTHYRRLAAWGDPPFTLLDVTLETGRTHQIRVHMESIEHHVVGDRVYGRPAAGSIDPGRVWLHSWRLAFDHPMRDERIDLIEPLTTALSASLSALGEPNVGTVEDI